MRTACTRFTAGVGATALALAGMVSMASAALVTAASPAAARDDGLADTPPMGFNDWNSFGCEVDAALIEQTADLFVTSGLKAAGYHYVNIDDCWMSHDRDPATGRLVADPVKFPGGIKAVADYVHAKGLKIGIYESAGSETCAHFPGSVGHETVDAQTFAEWGIDYLKYDNCGDHAPYPDTPEGFIARYKAMGDALQATGRPIVYSLCEWGQQEPWTWAQQVGHLWRTTGDISDNWASLKDIVAQNAPLWPFARKGGWNDPDMLEVGNGGMTDTEYKTHFSLWSVMNAPLIIGTDLRRATPETMAIYLNKDVIALNQDPLAKQAKLLSDADGLMVFAKPLANGDVAVALYNSNDSAATVGTTARLAGLGAAPEYLLQDLWTKKTLETAHDISANVPAHATVLYRVSGNDRRLSQYEPSTVLSATLPASDAEHLAVPGSTSAVKTQLRNNGRYPIRGVAVEAALPVGWTLTTTENTTAKRRRTGQSLTTHWTLTVPASATPGSYEIPVRATYTWAGGHRQPGSATSSISLLVPTIPPSGATPLSDLAWVSEINGWGPPELDRSNGEQGASDGNPITINGVVYAKGIGAHANSEIRYYLAGRCTSLTTDVGVDDEKTSNSSVSFRILADDAVRADSGVMTPDDPARSLTADLTGAQWLTLQLDQGASNDSDHGDWAAPVLSCS